MKRNSLLVTTTCLLALILVIGDSATADQRMNNFRTSHLTGLRVGGWVHQGPEVPERVETSNTILETNVNKTAAFIDGYFAYRFAPALAAEFSLGAVSRGTVQFQDEFGASDVGNLVVYPFTLAARIYPLIGSDSRLQPFLLGGGGIFWGRRTVQFSTDVFNVIYQREDDSQTDFNYMIGGGVDYLAFDNFSLDLTARYMPIEFSDNLVTVQDYSALAITFGVKYHYRPAKQKR